MRAVWATLLLAGVMLAGCTGDSGGDVDGTGTTTSSETMSDTMTDTATGTSSPTPGTTTGTGTAAPRDPVTWEVEVRDNSFSPAGLTVQAGDTVKWVRVGSNPHTVTADDDSFHSGDCPGLDCFSPLGRQEFTHTFDAVGEAGYYCEIHGGAGGSGMSGVVSVLERYDETPE